MSGSSSYNSADYGQALQGKWRIDSIAGTVDKTHSSLTSIPNNLFEKELDSTN